jgi:hypothetical protein
MSITPGRPPYTTPNFHLPVPGGSEDADGVTALRALADKVDETLKLIEDQIPEPGSGGGGGGHLELIEDQILTAQIGRIEFADIPQTFSHLRLIIAARSSAGAQSDVASMQFNGITSNDYDWVEIQGLNGNLTTFQLLDTTNARLGVLPAQTAPQGTRGTVVVDLPDYSRDGACTFQAQTSSRGSTQFDLRTISGICRAADTIEAIAMFNASGFFAPGSRATLYGLQ